MYIAQIDFEILEKIEDDSQSQVIYELLAMFLHDGRIGKDYQVLSNESKITNFVSIPAEDAFSNFETNQYIPKQLEKLDEVRLSQPDYKILGKAIEPVEICKCKNSTAYILYTGIWYSITPLHCFDCFAAIPLYWLPRLESGDFFEVYIWQSDYNSCDSLQMHCQTGERFALKEMQNLSSSLSKNGLEICKEIFSLTNKPVYYYLYKHYGKSFKKEIERKCPSCKGNWLLDEQFHELFDFRCDKCHLLSNIAYSLR